MRERGLQTQVLIIGGELNYLEVCLCNTEQAFRLEKHIWDKEGAFVSTEHSITSDSIIFAFGSLIFVSV